VNLMVSAQIGRLGRRQPFFCHCRILHRRYISGTITDYHNFSTSALSILATRHVTNSLHSTLLNAGAKWYPVVLESHCSRSFASNPARRMRQMSNSKLWQAHVSENDRFTAILEGIS
jgi:hypothetical protein